MMSTATFPQTSTELLPARSDLAITCSRHFPDWLARHRVSLVVSTYQANKLLLLGLKPDGQLAVFERTFPRCLGLWSDGQTLWLSSQFQLWRLANVLAAGETDGDCDALYVPRHGYVTGDLDIHDLAVDRDGRLVFVNTLFSCLATVDEQYNFAPLWRPPFISKLAAEDRCHLNGLALADGQPRWVTACSRTDVGDGWRDVRADGGCVLDVASGSVVLDGLSMPHSPRWYRDRLWLLDSGRGQFGWVDLEHGRFEPVTFCPGYARGLTFVDGDAVLGLSGPRHEPTFRGLPLEAELARRQAVPRCSLQVVDLASGDVRHWVRIEGSIHELYDVAVLPGVVRPKALGFKTDEIRYSVSFADSGQVARWAGGPRA